ncbi:MAG: ATP-binding protein [Lamprobacter sp.]|uniref:ATP-binding protein n=1 Tax=Lamprobacter sp. TaxID=3100796 RepID=UPI002B2628A1|nr:ATP-binding protein [Lamprobacter sp.]MEA3643555.1 ATP-binding protein [Lamprobacter sp.]
MKRHDARLRDSAWLGRLRPVGSALTPRPGTALLSADALAERGRHEVRKILAARHEAHERRWQQHLAASGIPERFRRKGFADYQTPLAEQAQAWTGCQDFAATLSAGECLGETLLLLGGSGTGKTHLACAILANVIRAGRRGWYAPLSGALRGLRDAGSRRSNCSETEAFAQFSEPDLLVLDDVMGADQPGRCGLLFEILDARYAQQRATILISELSMAQLEALLGPRLMRRLHEGGLRHECFTWPSDHHPAA